jgi:hypothetical protein
MKFPFLSLLGLLFITLKLLGVITWSWWLVLLPVYGGLVILGLVFTVAVIVELRK